LDLEECILTLNCAEISNRRIGQHIEDRLTILLELKASYGTLLRRDWLVRHEAIQTKASLRWILRVQSLGQGIGIVRWDRAEFQGGSRLIRCDRKRAASRTQIGNEVIDPLGFFCLESDLELRSRLAEFGHRLVVENFHLSKDSPRETRL